MGTLKVDKIVSTTGEATSAPITFTGNTATLGSEVTIPAAGVSGTLGGSVTIPAAGVTGTIGSGVTIPAAGVTGTLGSGVTFPAGHVIQTISDTDTGTHRTTTSNSAWTIDIGGLSVEITSKAANSDFLISAHSGMVYAGGDRAQIDIKRVITGGATLAGIVGTAANGSDNYGFIHERGSEWHSKHGIHLDGQSLVAGTIITYTLVFRNDSNSTTIYWLHSSSVATLMVQEIAA